MPDPATDTSSVPSGGYDLVGDLSKSMGAASKGLADLTRGKIAADEKIEQQTQKNLSEDRAVAKEYFNREAASTNDLKPWNQQQEAQKYAYDPIEAFGSIGSLFGIFASAFTKAPMENALNASSAAMNAIRDGKQDEYKNAFKAWKENNELAIKRGEMMHRQMQDALELFTKDSQAGESAMRHSAVKFGDQRALALLDAGAVPELVQYYGALGTTMTKLTEANTKLTEEDFAHRMMDSMVKSGTPPQVAFTLAHLGDKFAKDPAGQQLVGAFLEQAMKEGKPLDAAKGAAIATEVTQLVDDLKSMSGAEHQAWTQRQAELQAEKNEDGSKKYTPAQAMMMAAQEVRPAFQAYRASGTAGSPLSNEKKKEKEDIKAGVQRDHPNWSADKVDIEATRKLADAHRAIDQSIVNQLEHYPDMSASDLGSIQPQQQLRLSGAFDSANNLETIAKFAKENPKAIGLFADVSRRMNLDVYVGQPANTAIPKVEADIDKALDDETKRGKLDLSQIQAAKVLNKLLTTQAFADAATAGGRGGGTIYLDRAFKDIYQQGSSPGTFYSILEKRYDEANRVAEKYKMGFNHRDDLEKMPFWTQGAAGYVGAPAGKKKAVNVKTLEDAFALEPNTPYITPDGKRMIR